MDSLEKVEVENLFPSVPDMPTLPSLPLLPSLPSLPSAESIIEWMGEHVFELVLVVIFLLFVLYKYGQKEISMATGYKSILDDISHRVNSFFGRFWLSTNMEGNAIKAKVRFNEDDNEEYEDDREEMIKSVMYI